MANDLISRKAAIDALEGIKYWIWEPDVPSPPIPDDVKDMLEYLDLWIKRIKEEPAVDAVQVIRCKDCKYSEHWYRDKRRCFLWHETGIDVFEDGYCNYAERKDNG